MTSTAQTFRRPVSRIRPLARASGTLLGAAIVAATFANCLPAPPPGYGQSGLALQPTSAWTQNAGTINAVCSPAANPREAAFVDVGSGVELSALSDQALCCTCTARSRSFQVPATPVAGARLQGVMIASRGPNDLYAVASMRVTVKLGGAVVGSTILAQESRPNDNCAWASELPETIVPDDFDVAVSSFAGGGTTFDELDVDLQGYACGDASSQISLQSLAVDVPTSAVAASTSPGGAADGGAPDASPTATPAPPTPATVGFFPVACVNPADPTVRVQSGACPNGPDLRNKTTVTCIVSPCSGAGCEVTGTLTANGDVAEANCGALLPECDAIAASVPNPQVTIPDRIPCL
jgi:hypothetical protein